MHQISMDIIELDEYLPFASRGGGILEIWSIRLESHSVIIIQLSYDDYKTDW